MRVCFAAVALAACSSTPAPVARTPGPAPRDAAASSDAPEPSQQERLAAIEKAMNELDEAAQACWAAAAAVRFDIEGELVATIDIGASLPATVALASDTTRNAQLVGCMKQVLANYPWAPPLAGQTIQLPFKFRAPNGQSVIDRALVPWVGQGAIHIATLLDEANTGSEAASMFELALAAGASTGSRIAERAELWFFLGAATVVSGGKRTDVAAGDMMFVPPTAARDVIAKADLHAVVAMVPGGREGAARAGALPTREGTSKTAAVILPASAATSYCLGGAAKPCPAGSVTIFAEPATTQSSALAASLIEFPRGAAVAEHVHAAEAELLYMLAGTGTLRLGVLSLATSERSVVQIPAKMPHAFAATQAVRALQIYAPAGPEQRFKGARK